MKAKHISLATALIFAALPAACTHPVVNLNAPQVEENSSHIYPLTVNTRLNERNLVENTLKAYVVVEGEKHEMTRAPFGDIIFQYEYHMPTDRAQAKYYFLVSYDEKVESLIKHREIKTPEGEQPFVLNVVNRYVLQMAASRGVVGATVPVVGSGFQPRDNIVIGGVPASTIYASPNAMTFQVPALAPGDYPVEWHSGADVFQLGAFHVDVSNFTVTPASLDVASTTTTTLTIGMVQPAPAGGLPVSVTTDVPASVVMDEVRIPGGEKSVTVIVKGGQPGAGNLRISTPGLNTVTIPIKVGEAPPTPVVPAVTVPVEPAPVMAPSPMTPAPVPTPAPVIRGS